MDVEIGLLRQDEAMADARLRAQAFEPGLGPYYDPDRPTAGLDRTHVGRSGSKLVGTLNVLPLRQWFGGRALPMGGVAGVAVAPEVRGQGLAKRLMSDALVAMRDRGEVISALYPTTSSLYRSMGYEFGGRWELTTVDVRDLATISRGSSAPRSRPLVEALKPGELQRMRPLYDRIAAESNGWLDRTEIVWDRLDHVLNPDKFNSFGYVLTEDDQVVAGLTVAHRPSDNRHMFNVEIGGPFAASTDAFHAAMDLVAGLGTTAERATIGLPVETAALHLPGGILEHAESWLWMFRLVDVGEALRLRGYNPNVSARFSFELVDETAPWNAGRWHVEIADGSARIEHDPATAATHSGVPDGVHPVLDVQTLSSLFTGFMSPWEAAAAGRVQGADGAFLQAVAAAFAGQAPRLVDYF